MTIRNIAALVALLATQDLGAATFTVGPGGTHAEVGSAWQALVAAGPGSHEVRIAEGDFPISAELSLTVPSGSSVTISGGWDGSFQNRGGDRTATRIAGAGTHRLFSLVADSGQLRLDTLSLANGRADFDALLLAEARGEAELELTNLALTQGEAPDYPGCMRVEAKDRSRVRVRSLAVSQCVGRSVAALSFFGGTGLVVGAQHSAQVELMDIDITDNLTETRGEGLIEGAVMRIVADDDAQVSVSRFRIAGNRISVANVNGFSPLTGLYVATPWLRQTSNARVTLRRGEIVDNRCSNCMLPGAPQAWIISGFDLAFGGSPEVILSDTLIAQGASGLIAGVGNYPGTENRLVTLTNLTVTRHSGPGIRASGGSIFNGPFFFRLANTLAFDNQPDLIIDPSGTVDYATNAIGIDPYFIDPDNGNFRLSENSVFMMVNRGTDMAPGIGPRDLDGMPRREEFRVDIGAYEWRPGSPVFGSGFE